VLLVELLLPVLLLPVLLFVESIAARFARVDLPPKTICLIHSFFCICIPLQDCAQTHKHGFSSSSPSVK
jgi:hypothetical protein